jgi:hypothetical protein
MNKRLILIIFALSTPVFALEENYDACILANLQKAQSEVAVDLLKKTCLSQARITNSSGVSTSDMSDEELVNYYSSINECSKKSVKDMSDDELFNCQSTLSVEGSSAYFEGMSDEALLDFRKLIGDFQSIKADLKKSVDDESTPKEVKDFSQKLLKQYYKTQKTGRFWVEVQN